MAAAGGITQLPCRHIEIIRRVETEQTMSADMLTREQVEVMRRVIRQHYIRSGHEDSAHFADKLCDLALHGLDGARDAGVSGERALIDKCVAVLQRHIVPDGISDHDALSELYGLLDGPEYRALKRKDGRVGDDAPGWAIERELLLDALRLVLPMAKAYAHANDVGQNRLMVIHAEAVLAKAALPIREGGKGEGE
mgnify:CR=1 FL=1